MTIDEAIVKCKEITNTDANCPAHCNISCDKCVQESLQLAEWLEELKFLKQWKSDIMDSFCKYDVNSFEELVTNTRNKAIDDFATKICEILEEYQTGFNMVSMANIWHFSREFAEQLKEGILND